MELGNSASRCSVVRCATSLGRAPCRRTRSLPSFVELGKCCTCACTRYARYASALDGPPTLSYPRCLACPCSDTLPRAPPSENSALQVIVLLQLGVKLLQSAPKTHMHTHRRSSPCTLRTPASACAKRWMGAEHSPCTPVSAFDDALRQTEVVAPRACHT